MDTLRTSMARRGEALMSDTIEERRRPSDEAAADRKSG
jgi:hypothetical protein